MTSPVRPLPFVVQSQTQVTWGGETTTVLPRTVVDLVPGSALYAAYGGDANLKPLPPNQTGDDADHSHLGD